MTNNMEKIQFDAKDFAADLLGEGESLHIPREATLIIAERTVEALERWMKGRTTITKNELDQQIAKCLDKYNSDLAYVYQNRGKII